MELIFLKPAFHEKIWGGTALQKWFPKERLGNDTGESWVISAHTNGLSIIKNGPFKNHTLKELYEKQPILFRNPTHKTFPLLVKIIDANDNLSVQVHPDDIYALKNENELGKTECWYILDAKKDSKLIFGHTAKTKEEFKKQIENENWNDLLLEVPVKKGDFFYIPSGTVHAIGKGISILEVQQSSDTTYRLYDYDRIDEKGNKRELHIEKSIDVTTIPYEPQSLFFEETEFENAFITKLISNSFFTVKKMRITGNYQYKREANYILAVVISGKGKADGEELIPGTSFIIPATVDNVEFNGDFEMILSYQ